ncbi:MAG: DUF4956 domain-containing protein [Lachnospiraceae bacterium]|nr:DUF4956 domain-containing protein [Lachnospiraceae bacterium]
MSISDILRRTFLEGYATMNLQISDILACLLCTLAIGLYIYAVYRRINKNSFYNRNFNISLVALAVITAAIILTIQSNIVVSLGMVGALSIVRFRTAIKDPLDLVFLFWAISDGIICGAGFAMIGMIASVIITGIILLFVYMPKVHASEILLVNTTSLSSEADVLNTISKYCAYHQIKARNLSENHLDMAIEVRTEKASELLNELMEIADVYSTSLVAQEGDVTL